MGESEGGGKDWTSRWKGEALGSREGGRQGVSVRGTGIVNLPVWLVK